MRETAVNDNVEGLQGRPDSRIGKAMSEPQAQISTLVKAHPVLLFMKGTRGAPQCGFSARVVELLNEYLTDYETVNVLADEGIRAGIKEFSNWPTIPQLYVKGEFVGGCDIVTDMGKNGELDEVLGMSRPEFQTPVVFIRPGAIEKLKEFADGGPIKIRLEISPRWEYGLDFDDAHAGDVQIEGDEWTVLMNRTTARKADGLTIDFVEGAEGAGFKIDNPNEPKKVQQLSVSTLKQWLDGAKPIELFDVREPNEIAAEHIEGSRPFDSSAGEFLEVLDKTATLVFVCRSGQRSQRAAQHAIDMGFVDVHNVQGGMLAWASMG